MIAKVEIAPIHVSLSVERLTTCCCGLSQRVVSTKEKPLRSSRSFLILYQVGGNSFSALFAATPSGGYTATTNLM